MDTDDDYNREESERSRYRPQSRQSQHDVSSNGYHRHATPGSQRRGQQGPSHVQQQDRGYAYQEGQFDEPERHDDDMW